MHDDLKNSLIDIAIFSVFVGACLLCSLASLYFGLYAQEVFWRAGVHNDVPLAWIELLARCSFCYGWYLVARHFATRPRKMELPQ